jgi:muramoyltetrapeptide carboxypeptidase LdcA involved in peptidoglycan recycling
MGRSRESQNPETREANAARPARSSQPPVLKLVSQRGRIEAFAAAKGSAPGGYTQGLPLLEPGARVGILCDTLHGDREIGLDYQAGLQAAAELVRWLGFEPVIDRTHAAVAPYFERWAGSVEERASHFVRLVRDYRVEALFPLFGKGGCHAVVDAVAASGFRPSRPLVLIGGFSQHSDWALFAQSERGRGFFSHVLNTTQCAYWKLLPRANIDNLRAVLHGAASVEYTGLVPLNQVGAAEIAGPLSGGNLSAVLFNRHKAWMPSLRGRIVLCEDYDRHAHDVHRSFSAFARHVERADALAIVVSALLPIKRAAHAQLDAASRQREQAADHAELDAIVREVASRTRIPVFRQAAVCGHGAMNYPLGMGGAARIVAAPDGSYTLHNDLTVQS